MHLNDPANMICAGVFSRLRRQVGELRFDAKWYFSENFTGLELEDGGERGTSGFQWEKRLLMNEIMTVSVDTRSVVSMTLALLEDSVPEDVRNIFLGGVTAVAVRSDGDTPPCKNGVTRESVMIKEPEKVLHLVGNFHVLEPNEVFGIVRREGFRIDELVSSVTLELAITCESPNRVVYGTFSCTEESRLDIVSDSWREWEGKRCEIPSPILPEDRDEGLIQDAIAGVKRLNNVQLDGKPMKIEIVGTNIVTPPAPLPNGAFGFEDTNGVPRRLAKARERKGRDLDQVRCIKGEDDTVLVEDGHIKNKWQSYFHRLLNDEGDRAIVLGELEHSEECRDFSYCRRFKVEEVREAVRRMRRGRATGPDEIPVDFWKFAGEAGVRWLTGLFNEIFKTAKMPEAWRWSTMIPRYKNKGDIQSCNNYRGLSY
ncbi:THO complex subunit 4A [Capsicum baccatum]|uniref:THO complex subunit 4A n=1 Tax=Capsicum baccatum TaxID=33114 RepID=A0A2G2VAC6_CAPBA|nr:THO complex subunit 4A [Capsicum baccatum]